MIGIKKIKRKILLKYLQLKLKFSNFNNKIKNIFKRKTKFIINLKYNLLSNLTYYKALGQFILKVLMYGLIIYGLSGAIWGYKFSIFIASISSYILYETIVLEDIPEVIIKIGSSINGGKNK